MRSRVPALVTVTVFAVAVALVAVLAGRGSDGRLVKLPVASLGGSSADEAAGAGVALSRSALAYPGPMEYRVEGTLPDLPSTAPGYRLGASTTVAAVARLAASLGLVGDVREDENGWLVRAADRELRVERLPGLPWYVTMPCQDVPVSSDGGVASCAVAVDTPLDESFPTPVPDCPPELECVPPGLNCAPDEPCAVPAPLPTDPPARPVELPPVDDARTLARDTFARIGAGTAGFVIEDGWSSWQARVETTVDGVPVLGMGTSLSIGPKNAIVAGNGFLAVPDRIGDYPLVGVEAGLKRLTDGGGGFGGGGGPQTLIAPSPGGAFTKGAIEPAPEEGVEGCGDPAVSCVAPTVPTPVVQIVTGAHLALLHTGEALVPAYVFELADGAMAPVPAVTDEWLDTDDPTIVED